MIDLQVQPQSSVATVENVLTWQRAISAYLQTLQSPRTRTEYGRYLRAAAEAIGKTNVRTVTGEDLLYYGARVRGVGEVRVTQVMALVALRGLMNWLRARRVAQMTADDIADALKLPKRQGRIPRDILSHDEQARLIAACRTPRDRAMVAVLLGTGLRCQELLDLDVIHVRQTSAAQWVEVHAGKGGRRRRVPMSPAVLRLVLEYLNATGRTLRSAGPLWLPSDRAAGSRRPGRLSGAALRALVTSLCRDAGIVGKRISVHSFRHTFAVGYLRQRPDKLEHLRRLMGHASITTTQIYADHLTEEELLDEYTEVPGVDHAA